MPQKPWERYAEISAQSQSGPWEKYQQETIVSPADRPAATDFARVPHGPRPTRPLGPIAPPSVPEFSKPLNEQSAGSALKTVLDIPLDLGAGAERVFGIDPIRPIASIPEAARNVGTGLVRAATSPLETAANLGSSFMDTVHAGGNALRRGDLPAAAQSVGSGAAMGEGAKQGIRGAIAGTKMATATTLSRLPESVLPPESLMARAANLRSKVNPNPSLPITKTGVIDAAVNATRTPRAALYEKVAMMRAGKPQPTALTLPEDFPNTEPPTPTTLQLKRVTNAVENRPSPSRAYTPPESQPLGIERPGLSPDLREGLSKMREAQSVADRVRQAQENAYANRNAPEATTPRRWSQYGSDTYTPTPREIPRNLVADADLEAIRNAPPKAVESTAPLVNKWMNVSAKSVMRGSDPGAQLLKENLIGATKEATKTNVDTALGQAGQDMQSALESAGKTGKTFDVEKIITDALDQAQKRIGAPKDSAFQSQLSGVLDDIVSRYPNLRNLTPTETHALKVELGDAAKWSGTAFDEPVNQVLVQMYRDLNSTIKNGIADIGPLQERWGNLYVATKSLAESLAKDKVGRGTGSNIGEALKKTKR